ncbi:hypothetical protein IGS68_34370 (plasmid) [Skermanella sp. TT6]|uniref:TrbC/VIRB2 family protein n=1 Tax=Skermanella cutis TaxID=2775420 RepID=A0ABX7BLC8_9PROT|nr:hypothetical protein [Skermanella sp. TT6]QQP93812.1 hypothetical protein IGS68_34370 [Skermanella sp. TT6]
MKTNQSLSAAIVLGLTAFAGPALAQIPANGIETFTQDIWDFMIQNVGLMIVGLAIIGALLGAMVGDPGRGIGKAIVGAAIGAFIGGVPLLAEYVLGLGGA